MISARRRPPARFFHRPAHQAASDWIVWSRDDMNPYTPGSPQWAVYECAMAEAKAAIEPTEHPKPALKPVSDRVLRRRARKRLRRMPQERRSPKG